MTALSQFQNSARGVGRAAFDLPVAALAALAIAFFAFVVPADLLGRAVEATGLPSLLAAAEPPLGFKARAAIALVGGGAGFALVFLLLRRLDAVVIGAARPRPVKARPIPAPAPAVEDEEGEEVEELPRLRRRDAHPDAPARRPISAVRDLGEPAPPAAAPAETPAWLAPMAEPEPEPVEPVAAPAPAVEPEPVVEPEPEPAPVAEASLAELMERLQHGLARRRTRPVFAPPPHQSQPAPQVFPEAADARLQNAIDGLQRLARRAD